MDYIANEYDDEAEPDSHNQTIEIVNPKEVLLTNEEWPNAAVIDWRIL